MPDHLQLGNPQAEAEAEARLHLAAADGETAAKEIEEQLSALQKAGFFCYNPALGISDGFSRHNLRQNIKHLGLRYEALIDVRLVDERDFIVNRLLVGSPVKAKAPLAPFSSQRSKRTIDWGLVSGLEAALPARPTANSPFVPPATPITVAMEMNR